MDDLTQIPGIGKATGERLVAAGIKTFQQLAHDAVAGENGVKAEWIAAAAARLAERNEARPDASGAPEETGSPSAPDLPQNGDPAGEAPEGTNSDRKVLETAIQNLGGDINAIFPHTPPSDDAGGAGDPASPAGGDTTRQHPLVPLPDDHPFRQEYPLLSKAIDDWKAAHPDGWPPTVRISSRWDGFRRCGIAHPKAATDHDAVRFDPEQMERLLGEPVLTVELV